MLKVFFLHTSCNMPMNSEKAQFSWLIREFRKGVAMSSDPSSTSTMCRWKVAEGHGAAQREGLLS